jgi:hypothetical protein
MVFHPAQTTPRPEIEIAGQIFEFIADFRQFFHF